MLIVGGVESDLEVARDKARDAVTSGRALERFRACVEAQGGDPRVLDDTKLGRVVMDWGGGRRRLEDRIDYAVGLRLQAKISDRVDAVAPLLMAYYNDESKFEEMQTRLRAAYRIEDAEPVVEPLIKAII
jgi:thymidine phosphorylase